MVPDQRQIDQILPVKQAFEDQLLELPGVTGVDVGLKEVDGEKTPTHAILVFVAHKGEYEPTNEIPTMIEGVPTDVIEAIFEHQVGVPDATAETAIDSKRYDPAQGGTSISPARFDSYYGSLGMIVADAGSGAPLWLSAYHVMCNDPPWSQADKRIVQPAVDQTGNPASDTIGNLIRGVYGEVDVPWGYNLYVDAAVCDISGRAFSKSILGVGTPLGARNPMPPELVQKYGAATGYRVGKIVSTNFTAIVGGTTFYYQYRAEPLWRGMESLSEAGDSGAAVLDLDGYALGLIIAGNNIISVINPIGQIFAALELKMPA